VTEELHDADETHTGIEEFGGIGVSQPMGDDRAVEVETICALSQGFSQTVFDPPPCQVRGKEKRCALRAALLQLFDQALGLSIEGYEAIVVELSEGDFQESVAMEVGFQASGDEMDELSDAHTGASHEEEGLAVEVVALEKTTLHLLVGFDGKRFGQGVRNFREVRGAKQVLRREGEHLLLEEPSQVAADVTDTHRARARYEAALGEGF
jgi:hypothetical protein